MFIREKSFKNKDGSTRTYLQLVETARENGRVRQRVVANLGRLDELQQNGQLERLVEGLNRYTRLALVKKQAAELRTGPDREWGPALVFKALWENLGLGPIIRTMHQETELTFDVDAALFAMVLNRLCDPFSKLGVSKWIDTVYHPAFAELELHHFYRALDFLAERKEQIEEQLFNRVRDLFHLKLDLVFWDTTSTYFEGNGPCILACYGHSKDSRPDRLQVVVGLLMTQEGIPVAHEVFPGNMADVKSFAEALRTLTKRFLIRKVILVGDRGMVSDTVLKEIEAQGLEYIVGVRMRKVKAMDQVLSRPGRYREIQPNLKVKEVRHEGKRYIVCFNPEEAEYDRQARESMVQKLKEKLQKDGLKSLVGNSGYRRFLKVSGTEAVIDEKAIEEEARYDGKYVLTTNNATLSPEEIALAYKDLWRVERAFREMKSGLDLRPIFHWKDARVRGHIMVCFLAFLLESALRRRLQENNYYGPYIDLMQDLKQVRAFELELNGTRYLLRPPLYGKSYEAFKAVGIRPPSEVNEMPRNHSHHRGEV
ncbi:MAG: IS1634 family transposase [Thermoanaerobacteraceae bacterium]|nr:IS1634 family transposase [Thermoanaerobacteraceae bacterium]